VENRNSALLPCLIIKLRQLQVDRHSAAAVEREHFAAVRQQQNCFAQAPHLADAASSQQPGIEEGVALSAQPEREVAPGLATALAPVWVLPDLRIVPVQQ
jgi:hypothetical protein